MRIDSLLFTVIFGSTLIDIVVAQNSGTACVLNCSSASLSASPCQSLSDLNCICNNKKYQDAVQKCLQDQCQPADMATAQNLQEASCPAKTPSEQQNPPEEKKPAEEQKPVEEQKKPVEEQKNQAEQQKPVEEQKSEEQKNQAEQQNPSGNGSDCISQCNQESLNACTCKEITDLQCICTNNKFKQNYMTCLTTNKNCTPDAILNAQNLYTTNCAPFLECGPDEGALSAPAP